MTDHIPGTGNMMRARRESIAARMAAILLASIALLATAAIAQVLA